MNLQNPPLAPRKPHTSEVHGVRWDDEWHWLRDPNYPDVQDEEVLAYLKAENDFFETAMAPHKALTDELFEEMKGRIKEDDATVPLKDGDWLYWSEFKKGTQYRDWYRKPVLSEAEGPANGADGALIFSENAEAEGKEYY